MPAALAGQALTVLGPVPAETLGVTLPHEHLLLDLRFMFREPAAASARGRAAASLGLANHYAVTHDWFDTCDNLGLEDEALAIEEARLFQREGGRTLVDPTSVGIARDPLALQRVARATGLHVVMGAGYYVDASHPPDMAGQTEDGLVREIVRDVREGVGETRVRAGLVGEIGCSWPWTPNERKSLRAAAAAARETGAPLMVHPGRHPDAPAAHLGEVRRVGLDLHRVIVCHVERTIPPEDRGRLQALAETGGFLEYDLFGMEVSHYPFGSPDVVSDAERMRQIIWLLERGHGRQVLVSHDICFKMRLTRHGGHGYAHLLRHVVPRLRRKGLGAADIGMLLVDNPARAFAFV